jgi:hypothetical protein
MRALLLSGFVSLALLSACTSEIQTFTAISTHSVDYDSPIVSGDVIKKVRATDLDHIIFFIPTGTPTLQSAVDNALKENDADIMLNVKTYRKMWWIPYIYGQNRYVVEGDAVRFQRKK